MGWGGNANGQLPARDKPPTSPPSPSPLHLRQLDTVNYVNGMKCLAAYVDELSVLCEETEESKAKVTALF